MLFWWVSVNWEYTGMRDNHDGYPEIVNAYEREGQYFGALRVVIADATLVVEFGVSEAGYHALKRILDARPFDSMPGIPQRYFFTGSFTGAVNAEQNSFIFRIRIEQGTAAKQFEFSGPKSLLENLLWFQKLKSTEEISHLQRLD
jgi:hypothetical protein